MRRASAAEVLLALVLVARPSVAAAAHGDTPIFFDDDGEVDGPQNLVEGPDGNLWFTSTLNDRVGYLDRDDSSFTTFDAQVDTPWDITVGPDGNLWSTGDAAIGRITPAGVVTTFPDATIAGGHDIAALGNQLWFTSTDNDRIGSITTAGVVTTYPDAGLDGPTGLTVGPFTIVTSTGIRTPPTLDFVDVIWFANTGADQVGWMGPGTTDFHYISDADLDTPTDIVADPQGGFGGYGGVLVTNTGNELQASCSADSFGPSIRCVGFGPGEGVTDIGPIDMGTHVEGQPSHPFVTDLADDSVVTRNGMGTDTLTLPLAGADGVTDLLTTSDGELWFTSHGNDGIGNLVVDRQKPIVTVTGIEDGDDFLRTDQPSISIGCQDPPGDTSGMLLCQAVANGVEVENGGELPDNGIGERHLYVHGVDNWGNWTIITVDYTVQPTTSCAGHPATVELAFGDEVDARYHPLEPEVVVGTSGDDTVDAIGTDHIICLGAGDDSVELHFGQSEVHLGTGDDTVTGGWQGTVFGGPGDDLISNDHWYGPALTHGDGGDDIIHGRSIADDLDGGPGDDQVLGGGGNDNLWGRAGKDRLDGGKGGDRLAGGFGDDVLFGRAGADVLDGGDGDDIVNGGSERDLCAGGPGRRDRPVSCELKAGFP